MNTTTIKENTCKTDLSNESSSLLFAEAVIEKFELVKSSIEQGSWSDAEVIAHMAMSELKELLYYLREAKETAKKANIDSDTPKEWPTLTY